MDDPKQYARLSPDNRSLLEAIQKASTAIVNVGNSFSDIRNNMLHLPLKDQLRFIACEEQITFWTKKLIEHSSKIIAEIPVIRASGNSLAVVNPEQSDAERFLASVRLRKSTSSQDNESG